MKFLHSLLLPMVASSQLLGFGGSCPVIDIEVTNVGNVPTDNIMAVAHSPDIQLIPEGEPLSDAAIDLIVAYCEEIPFDGALTPALFGVDVSDDVCGDLGEGYTLDTSGAVFPGESYPTMTMAPVNKASCSCSNMRISILAVAESFCAESDYYIVGEASFSTIAPYNDYGESSVSAAVFLNSHELQSGTTTSYATAGYLGMTCNDDTNDCWARPVTIGGTLESTVHDSDTSCDVSASHLPNYSSSRGFSVTFIPTAGSSTSFLSLWALLMHGWY